MPSTELREVQQTLGCVHNSPELHYSNQCRRASRGKTLEALQTEMLRTAGRIKCDLVEVQPPPPPGQVSLRHTARCLICTSVLSLTLKPRSRNQAIFFFPRSERFADHL